MRGKIRNKIENLFLKSYFLCFTREFESLLFHLVSCRSPLAHIILTFAGTRAPVRLLLKYPLRQFLYRIKEKKRKSSAKRSNRDEKPRGTARALDGRTRLVFFFSVNDRCRPHARPFRL